MRNEAETNEWAKLYEVATRIKELKPWENFWDMDLVAVQDGEKEDTIFYSILGRGGDCYGIAVYEGYEGLNNFLMLTLSQSMNLSSEYAMFSQKNLTCYWGNREELTEKQRKTIKELGYKYRGKNQWLYFLSFEPGYYPFNLDQDEVSRMTSYLEHLEQALNCHKKENLQVDFERGHMLLYKAGKDKQTWELTAEPLPFTAYQFQNLILTDDELLDELSKASRCNHILEADITYLGARVGEKEYDRPANPRIYLLGDARTEMILKFDMIKPQEDAFVALAEAVVGFILQFGAPKEIRVSNVVVEATLEQICSICKIRLRRVKTLGVLESFRDGMSSYCSI